MASILERKSFSSTKCHEKIVQLSSMRTLMSPISTPLVRVLCGDIGLTSMVAGAARGTAWERMKELSLRCLMCCLVEQPHLPHRTDTQYEKQSVCNALSRRFCKLPMDSACVCESSMMNMCVCTEHSLHGFCRQ